ncbi:MAG: BCD family MFS transporter [Myxococcota bacterium]
MKATASKDKLPIGVACQLGLVFAGQGLLSLLVLGVMNRIMIDEQLLAVPALVATACLSVRFFVSPLRIYLGQLTDSRPLLGSQRTGYIRVSLPLACGFLMLALQAMWQLGGDDFWLWAVVLGALFGLYGISLYMVSVAGLALIHDITPEDQRSQVMGVVWSMLLLGVVAGAIAGPVMLKGVDKDNLRPGIDEFFLLMCLSVLLLGYLGTWGVERRFSRRAERVGSRTAEYVGFFQAIRIFISSRQSVRFFVYLSILTLGIFMQQPVLEPFGGEVFAMTIGETTRLNAFSFGATLFALIATGFTLTPWLGPWHTTRIGLLVCALGFLGIVGSGLLGPDGSIPFYIAISVMGLGAGISTNSMLGIMLSLAPPERAGLFLGTFGMAQYLSQAGALLLAGVIVDLGRYVLDSVNAGYSLVFVAEAIILLGCIGLLGPLERGSAGAESRAPSVTEMLGESVD